jgi:hypothetical protein
MADRNEANAASHGAKRTRRLWLIPLMVAVLAVVAWFLWVAGFWRDSRSPDERLAEIEAARAIPDAENAALIYEELLQDPNATSLSTATSQTGEPLLSNQVLYRPWLSKDQPEVNAWIRKHQYIIDRLLAAARFEKCRFPISIDITDTSPMDRGAVMRQWGFLLRSAANNDIAEGRIDAALTKWQCLLRMESHLRQQPTVIDHLLANSLDDMALASLARFLVKGDTIESYLQKTEAMQLPIGDNWAEQLEAIRSIENLRLRKMKEQISALDYIKHPIQILRWRLWVDSTTNDPSRSETWAQRYRASIAAARGVRILTALRRFRNTTGCWPESLEEIKSSLPEEILTDPFNKSSFVYQPAGNTFRLYSRGLNNIDQNGDWQSEGADDWPIWPPRQRGSEPEPRDADGV